MSFSRSFLKASGLSDEQITAVMEEHNAVVDALKQQRDGYKADAEKLSDVQKQLDDLKGGEDYQAKYDAEHKAFEDYKEQVKAEAELGSKKDAYRKLLAEEKISDKRYDAVIRLTDFGKMKLDKDGNLANADELRKAIRDEWGEYIVTTRTEHENVATPPKGQGNGMLSRDDIFKRDENGRYVHTTEERQKLIAENPQAFR